MGAKSTIDITCKEAISKIIYFLDNASNEAIADALEILNDDARERGYDNLGLHNFTIKE